MKKILSTVLTVLLCITAFGQIDIKEIDKSLEKINDNLYASKFEVSNKQYMAFLNSLGNSNKTDLLAIAQLDTLNWKDKSGYNEPYVRYYHRHPAYEDYPVVNISHNAAKLFTEWLTEQYNSNPKRKFEKVIFRLPTEKEWIIAAQAGDNASIYGWQGNDLLYKKGRVMGNFKRELKDMVAIEGEVGSNGDITAPVNSYWENDFGLFNMSGNVAEMVEEKGIAKGGSWMDGPESLNVNAKHIYNGKAQPYVGFRYFVEVLEKVKSE